MVQLPTHMKMPCLEISSISPTERQETTFYCFRFEDCKNSNLLMVNLSELILRTCIELWSGSHYPLTCNTNLTDQTVNISWSPNVTLNLSQIGTLICFHIFLAILNKNVPNSSPYLGLVCLLLLELPDDVALRLDGLHLGHLRRGHRRRVGRRRHASGRVQSLHLDGIHE